MNFLVSPALFKKPILPKEDPGRSQAKGPFVDPDPNFVLGSIGPDHTLVFNKYCVSRPMFLLHTKTFQLQKDDLNASDFAAIWSLLTSFKSPQIVLYNCGADAGASQGHKHLQMFPAPDPKNCVMFPERMELSYGEQTRLMFLKLPTTDQVNLEEVKSYEKSPFQNFVIGLEPGINTQQILTKYNLLLSATKNALKQAGTDGNDYNVILVPGWMALIPRTHASYHGKAPANGAGMMGMAWVKDDMEVAEWLEFGVAKHLAYMGLAKTVK